LIIDINWAIPPLSPDEQPSTSSIRIMNFFLVDTSLILSAEIKELSVKLVSISLRAFLLLTSDAFYSTKSYFIYLAINLMAVVFPIPGGPETSTALYDYKIK
jgi:hypothetical protein